MNKENKAKDFLIEKGVTGDFKTLRLKPRIEEGTLVDWMNEFAKSYHQSRLYEITDEDIKNQFPDRNGKLCYNLARQESCNWLLKKLKKNDNRRT